MGAVRLAGFCLLAALLQVGAAGADDSRTYDKVSFYFAAHEDDWQLFMNPSAFQDVVGAKTKGVFIHTTAGDAGSGIGWRGRKHPFYLARENGAEAAIRFMVDADQPPATRAASHQTFNGHAIYRVTYGNTVSYFLRLPDGNPQGSGYFDTGFQSLRLFAQRDVDMLTAIDGSAVYRGWKDLTATVRAIVDFERGRAPAVQLNVAELDPRLNPDDHSDHLMTARAALDAVAGLGCIRRVHYLDYASRLLPENLSAQERDLTSSVFAVTVAGIRALDHGSNWRWYDQAYVGRDYFRVEEGKGRCDPATSDLVASKH